MTSAVCFFFLCFFLLSAVLAGQHEGCPADGTCSHEHPAGEGQEGGIDSKFHDYMNQQLSDEEIAACKALNVEEIQRLIASKAEKDTKMLWSCLMHMDKDTLSKAIASEQDASTGDASSAKSAFSDQEKEL